MKKRVDLKMDEYIIHVISKYNYERTQTRFINIACMYYLLEHCEITNRDRVIIEYELDKYVGAGVSHALYNK